MIYEIRKYEDGKLSKYEVVESNDIQKVLDDINNKNGKDYGIIRRSATKIVFQYQDDYLNTRYKIKLVDFEEVQDKLKMHYGNFLSLYEYFHSSPIALVEFTRSLKKFVRKNAAKL